MGVLLRLLEISPLMIWAADGERGELTCNISTMPRLAVTLLAVSALVVFLHAAEDCVTSANPGACFHSQGRFADARRPARAHRA